MRAHPTFKLVRLMVRVACIISYNNACSLRDGLHEGGHARDRETTVQRRTEFNNPSCEHLPRFRSTKLFFFFYAPFSSEENADFARLRDQLARVVVRRLRRSVNARLSRLPRLAGLQGQEITLKRR